MINEGKLDIISKTGGKKAESPEGLPVIEENDKQPGKFEPIFEMENYVSFLGVRVEKGKGGNLTPDKKRFEEEDVVTEYDHKVMQKIAVGLSLSQPVLIEGGSGIGKTWTVDRMCALLDKENYYANCHDFDYEALIGKPSTDEKTKSGFGWRDGVVLQAIRNGGVLVLDEYNFMNARVRGGMHQILDALLQGKTKITVPDNDYEIVEVHPDFRIVALQNPADKYEGRDILDPAQVSRFNILKEPEHLPRETKIARALGYIGKDNAIDIKENDYLHSNENKLSRQQISEIPGIEEIIIKFVEFQEYVEKMIENLKLGADDKQLAFASDRDRMRVMQFIARFYAGDINETMSRAIEYYYINKFQNNEDKIGIKLEAEHVIYVPPAGVSKRLGLEEDPEEQEKEKTLEEIEAVRRRIEKSGKVPEGFFAGKKEKLTGELSETIKQWQEFYQETFKITPDFSKLEIPEKREGFDKLLVIAKGMTPQKLFNQCKELFPAVKYTEDDLDKVITSDRHAKKESYAIWIRDRLEADKELKDLSADVIKKQGLVTETLEERLIQELEYFKRTNEHLDKETTTLCAGSRYADGSVPSVHWHVGHLKVGWNGIVTHDDHWRAREAVSSAGSGK